MKLLEKLKEFGTNLINPLAQTQDQHNPEKTVTPGMPELLRHAGAQGAVLLENSVLPFSSGTKVAVFGRVQCDWFCFGYGSGGDVNFPYSVGLLEALRNCEALIPEEKTASVYETWVRENPANHGVWGRWPRFHPEMPVTPQLVHEARQNTDQAIIVIGRSSGEDRENALEPGSYYLTVEEKQMLKAVTASFPQAVLVLNIGSVMDLSFVKEYPLGAVMIVWQGGMESGNAVADLLCGRQNPSGRLTDTVARAYEDYPCAAHFGEKDANEYYEDIYVGYRYFETFAPEKVLYPFGHGLSYTTFRVEGEQTDDLSFRATVTNTGTCPGANSILLYVQKPCGKLGNPARELVAFGKTQVLEPGASEVLTFQVTPYALSSYDDSGLTGNKSCYVLQEGEYRFFLGGDVRSAQAVGSHTQAAVEVVKQLTEAAAPARTFPILARENGETVPRGASPRTADLKRRILDHLPEAIFQTGDRGLKLKDVASGKTTLNAFVAQLDLTELEAISHACKTLGGWRLWHCTLYVTLEPCPMCAGAIINARIPRVVYGAKDAKAGSCGSVIDLFMLPYNHKPQVEQGLLEEECGKALSDFFKELREKRRKTEVTL